MRLNNSKRGRTNYGEGIASAQAVVRNMLGLAIEYPDTMEAIYRITVGRAEHITAEQVFRLGAEGDTSASHIVN
jgi:glucokinase